MKETTRINYLTSLTKVTWIVVQSTSTMKPKVTLPANTPKLKGENLWPGENRKMGNVRIGHLTKNAKLSNYFKILSPINNARTRLSVKSISIYFLTVKGKYQRLKEKVNNLMTKGEQRKDSQKKQLEPAPHVIFV